MGFKVMNYVLTLELVNIGDRVRRKMPDFEILMKNMKHTKGGL